MLKKRLYARARLPQAACIGPSPPTRELYFPRERPECLININNGALISRKLIFLPAYVCVKTNSISEYNFSPQREILINFSYGVCYIVHVTPLNKAKSKFPANYPTAKTRAPAFPGIPFLRLICIS